MSNSHDEDDWSNDSASLFREARRAHDPTLAESARLAAVLPRIQAAKAEASVAPNRGADIVARGATSEMLRLVASVSIGIVLVAAAVFAIIRAHRHPPEPARSAKDAAAALASAPPPTGMQSAPAPAPAPAPSGELSAPAQASATRDEAPSRPRSQWRRPRANAERQPTSPIEIASVPEDKRPEPGSAVKPVAVVEEVAPPATSSESNPREPVTAAARKADPTPPGDASTELAMMKRIQGGLRDADFSTVLALCAEHARRWPHGVFEVEREGVRAIASCGGSSDDAALRAKRFLAAHPHAPVAMRVSAACAARLIER